MNDWGPAEKKIAAKALAFREKKLAKAKTDAYLANMSLQYWEQLTVIKAIDAMKDDDDLTARLKDSDDHAALVARREKQAKENEDRLKIFGAFVAGAMVAAYVAVIFLRG